MKPAHIAFFEDSKPPIPASLVFEALTPAREIILAANPRATIEVIEGILKAAKDTENIVILELALSEMNLEGGYTGLTPIAFAQRVKQAAENVGWFGYVLHADHITVKKGTDEEIKRVKEEIKARVDAGYTSFQIDSSFLFDKSQKEISMQLKRVCDIAIELFKYLYELIGHRDFGREGEVGEVGASEFTEVKEALYYVKKLSEENIDIHWMGIANGSKHGVSVDAEGNIIPQLGINIKRTIEIVEALWSNGFRTRIAQHGITGTPLHLIAEKFPKGVINKGNVGTHWMLLVYDVMRIFEPDLYNKVYKWVIEKYGKEGVPEVETFYENSKFALKEFFYHINNMSDEARMAIRAKAYADALMHLKAFGMEKSAKRVYDYIRENNKKYW